MSESEKMGRCRQQLEAWFTNNISSVPRYSWMIADAIDRLAADVEAIKAKVDAVSPEDVKHFVDSEKAWVALVTEQRDAAIRERDEARADAQRIQDEADDQEQTDKVKRLNAEIDKIHYTLMNRTFERDEARAEVERLNAELAARPADGNRQATLDSSSAAPQPAAPAAGWLTDRERRAVAYFAQVCRDDLVPDGWTDNAGVLLSLLARAGSPPVVEVPALGFLGDMTGREQGIVLAYRDALDAAGVPWKENGVPRE